jgi:choline-glycine betaine transporter
VIVLGIPILIVVICAMVGMWMQVKERDGGVPVVVAEIRELEDMYKEKNNQLWDVYKDEKLEVIRNNQRMRELWAE